MTVPRVLSSKEFSWISAREVAQADPLGKSRDKALSIQYTVKKLNGQASVQEVDISSGQVNSTSSTIRYFPAGEYKVLRLITSLFMLLHVFLERKRYQVRTKKATMSIASQYVFYMKAILNFIITCKDKEKCIEILHRWGRVEAVGHGCHWDEFRQGRVLEGDVNYDELAGRWGIKSTYKTTDMRHLAHINTVLDLMDKWIDRHQGMVPKDIDDEQTEVLRTHPLQTRSNIFLVAGTPTATHTNAPGSCTLSGFAIVNNLQPVPDESNIQLDIEFYISEGISLLVCARFEQELDLRGALICWVEVSVAKMPENLTGVTIIGSEVNYHMMGDARRIHLIGNATQVNRLPFLDIFQPPSIHASGLVTGYNHATATFNLDIGVWINAAGGILPSPLQCTIQELRQCKGFGRPTPNRDERVGVQGLLTNVGLVNGKVAGLVASVDHIEVHGTLSQAGEKAKTFSNTLASYSNAENGFSRFSKGFTIHHHPFTSPLSTTQAAAGPGPSTLAAQKRNVQAVEETDDDDIDDIYGDPAPSAEAAPNRPPAKRGRYSTRANSKQT